ncbi:hypothetical protein PF005_g8502 [Phytophthora fragariae]|uniref:Reverse transcriptase RNase H-like domain-containing protein n=2 Tax=Phytophthora TaxID=4783 RepID=A0A6A3YF90_9STRA|nr:hypothetical protein PF003_g32105 [Phytophthora fragariae]KAE9023007.1 hypothetical protein PR002_g11829 [Phytophthora rubi]KAE8940365.1 hypothetical protein PF009_g9829 [Phytophthora fragariae]KAE9016221.1 hypothetical protein PF011_g7261 [Phytophthora fragariae]KAE9117180.1 hypothetical protein PF007_g9388 [Phytophthora fragariae]
MISPNPNAVSTTLHSFWAFLLLELDGCAPALAVFSDSANVTVAHAGELVR